MRAVLQHLLQSSINIHYTSGSNGFLGYVGGLRVELNLECTQDSATAGKELPGAISYFELIFC